MRKRNASNLDLEKHPIAANEGGILVAILRSIIRQKGWSKKVGYLIDRYGHKIKNQGDNNLNKVKSKSTVIADLLKNAITFKVFIYICKYILGITKLTIIVEAEFADKQVVVAHQKFAMDNLEESIEEEETENITKEKDKDGNQKTATHQSTGDT